MAAIPPLFAFLSSLWLVTPLGTTWTHYTARSTAGDPALRVSRSFSSNAGNRFLRCLLFPSASDPAAHIAEFTRVCSIPQEGSITAF